MNEILALRDEHDLASEDAFHFQYARVAFAAGRTETAIASLNEYLLAAGQGGEFYRDALELLDAAEVTLRRAEEGRRRVEDERRRAARWPAGKLFRDCATCPEMVVLPGGTLAMGRHEVTVGEYRAFAAATGAGAPPACRDDRGDGDSWRNPGFAQTDRHPVTCMSWNDAQAYVSWLTATTGAPYRLPTEAEWARVATGSQPGCYMDGGAPYGTCPVGTYGGNGSGLSDMVGNVWEWMSDCVGNDCARRMLRGGSFWYFGHDRAPDPSLSTPSAVTQRTILLGFRVARPPE